MKINYKQMKLNITHEMVREIAGDLDIGMTCYVDKETGEIESLPDTLSPYFDSELWQDLIDKIDRNEGGYWIIEPMDSREAFQVMADFVDSLEDSQGARRLAASLQNRKPFQHFNHLIHESELREDWFAFKQKRYEDYVRNILDDYLQAEK